MNHRKHAKATIAIAMIGLFAASYAQALPGLTETPPQSGVNACIAEINDRVRIDVPTRVRHEVVSKERPVSGHVLRIRTLLLNEDGVTLRGEYASTCRLNGRADLREFRIRQRGD